LSKQGCTSTVTDDDYDDLAVTSSTNGDDDDDDEEVDDDLSNSTDSVDTDEFLFRTGKTDIDLHMHDVAGRQPSSSLVNHSSSGMRQQIAWEVTWTPNESNNNMNMNNPSAVRVL
jgi:hypothetical protein